MRSSLRSVVVAGSFLAALSMCGKGTKDEIKRSSAPRIEVNSNLNSGAALTNLGSLAIDATATGDHSTATAKAVTSPFSTTSANELLLAFIASDANKSGVTVSSMSGAGLTWVRVVKTNTQMGTAEIWRAFAPTLLSKVTVTATLSQSVAASITVMSFSGVDTTGTNGSGAIGAIGSGNATSGAPTASLVTTRNGSLVIGVGNDYDYAIARTVPSNQVLIHQYLATVGDTYWVQSQANVTANAGTTVTINDSAPTSDHFNLSICEILPAASTSPTGSITGSITPVSAGANALVTVSGASTYTTNADASGNYSFATIPNGTYTVTPSNGSLTFSPSSQSVNVNGATVSGINFANVSPTGSIAGAITPVAVGANALVTAVGASNFTTNADASGNYSFANLPNGSYTLTPSVSGVIFSPTSQAVNVAGAAISGINFAEALPTITAFSASPANINPGGQATLSWSTTGATSLGISQGIGAVSGPSGSISVTPSATTTYVLTAVNNAGSVTAEASVSVGNLLFDEEFSTNSLDLTQWIPLNRTGDPGNAEVECYIPGNVAVTGGNLVLTSKSDTSCAGHQYTSGAVMWSNFKFTYGTVEIRAKMAGGRGQWPALWLLGSNCQSYFPTTADNVGACQWPDSGSDEIDIAEVFSGNLSKVNENIYSSTGNFQCTATTTDTSQNWHVYSLVWAKGSMQWKIDGVTQCTANTAPSAPMFLIINTAMGGIGGGNVDPTTLPQTTQVDYVKVYQ